MWVCFSDSFLSIINADHPDDLLVRSRRPGDIEKIFPGVKVQKTPHRDYLFRAVIPRERVASVLASQVASIDYGNFKGSVFDHALHDAYAAVWRIMSRLQPLAPYSGGGRRGRTRDLFAD